MAEKSKFGYGEPRPILITIICIIFGLSCLTNLIALLFIPQVVYELIKAYGVAHPTMTAIFNIVLIVSYWGIWRLKLWGVISFGIVVVALSIYGIFIGQQFWWNFFPGIVTLLSCAYYLKYMN
jgi:hypothetical protein